MFGIAWGVGSLLLLVGLGEGFRSGQDKNLAELGQDIMFVSRGRIPAVAGSYQSGQIYYLTMEITLPFAIRPDFLRAVSPVLERDDNPRGKPITDPPTGRFSAWFRVQAIFATCRLNWALVQRRGQFAASPGRGSGWELLKNMFPGQPAVADDPAERYGF